MLEKTPPIKKLKIKTKTEKSTTLNNTDSKLQELQLGKIKSEIK